jgi:hypothetical protein
VPWITGKFAGAHTLPSQEAPMVDPKEFRFELHCPHCDQTDMQLIELLADKTAGRQRGDRVSQLWADDRPHK